MATRREARERALGLCYELETRGLSADELLAGLAVAPDAYAEAVVRGVDAHRVEIDGLLTKLSEHWALERMPAIDRALLRIGSYEIGWEPELPLAVTYIIDKKGRIVYAFLETDYKKRAEPDLIIENLKRLNQKDK